MNNWILDLPKNLQIRINKVIENNQENYEVLSELYNFLKVNQDKKLLDLKKRKVIVSNQSKDKFDFEDNIHKYDNIEKTSGIIILNEKLTSDIIIFELQIISFQSPIRKKMNLVFHLIEENHKPIPVLSIVNPLNQIPDFSIINLPKSIKFCIVFPILGNSTNTQKKSIISLLFWLNENCIKDTVKMDPILCHLNLDSIKKQLIKSGKLPIDVDNNFHDENNKSSLYLNSVHERIIDYFKRQFNLCGIKLIDYLPSEHFLKSKFLVNSDDVIALSGENEEIKILMIESYKGSKDGLLLFLTRNEHNPSYIIFGFKKPILIYETSRIHHVTFSSITINTFNIIFTIMNKKNEKKHVEFSMVNNKNYQIINKFFEYEKIPNNSQNMNFVEISNEVDSEIIEKSEMNNDLVIPIKENNTNPEKKINDIYVANKSSNDNSVNDLL